MVAFQPTPLGTGAAKSGMTPAKKFLDHRLARFTPVPLFQAPGQRWLGGNPYLREGRHHRTTQCSRRIPPGRDRRGPGVRRPASFPGSNSRRGECGSITNSERVETPGHHPDRRLTTGQCRGGSSVGLEGPRRVDPPSLPPQLKQRGVRCRCLCHLPSPASV